MATAIAIATEAPPILPLSASDTRSQPGFTDPGQCSREFVALCDRHARAGEPPSERCLRNARLLDWSGECATSTYAAELTEVLRKIAVVAELTVETHLRKLAERSPETLPFEWTVGVPNKEFRAPVEVS